MSAPAQDRHQRGAASHKRGLRAERLARLLLHLKLYRLIATRFKTPLGEIDLIAARGRTLAFIEVKARPDETQAGQAIAPQQQQRLARAATLFLAQNPRYARFHIRFDALLILPRRWPIHIENAFEFHPDGRI